MKKYRILFLALLHSCFILDAQNLVRNPGFETVTQSYVCDINPGTNNQSQRIDYYHKVYHWRAPKRCAPCLRLTPTSDVLCNGYLGKQANTGDKFGHTVNDTDSKYQEYLVGSLSSNLRVGTTYFIEFHTMAAYNGAAQAGLAFSEGVPCQCSKNLPDYEHAKVTFGSAAYATPGTWQKVRGLFRADKAYDHVLLGHFKATTGTSLWWDDITVRQATQAEINELDWTGLKGDKAQRGWVVGNFNVTLSRDVVMDDRMSHGTRGDDKKEPILSKSKFKQVSHKPGQVTLKPRATTGNTTTLNNPDDILRFNGAYGGADVLLSNRSAFNAPIKWSDTEVKNFGWYVGDFNGDGNDDIMKYYTRHGGAVVSLSTGRGFSPPSLWCGAGVRHHGWHIGDFNVDGKDDIFRYRNQHGGAEIFLSNGSSFVGPHYWSGAGIRGGTWSVGDFNGDGKSDLLRQASRNGGAEVFLSTGSGFQGFANWTNNGTRFIRETIQAFPPKFEMLGGWQVGDFNGDGKDDIMRFKHTRGGAEVFLSTGSSFQPPTLWTNYNIRKRGWHIGDFNGDGKVDLMRYLHDQGGAEVLLSTGSAFQNAVAWTNESVNN